MFVPLLSDEKLGASPTGFHLVRLNVPRRTVYVPETNCDRYTHQMSCSVCNAYKSTEGTVMCHQAFTDADWKLTR